MDLLTREWVSLSQERANLASQQKDRPKYWTSDPSSLLATSNLHSVYLGTGDQIYESILPTVQKAEHEVILVTCFWAKSSTQQRLHNLLQALSHKPRTRGRKIRVRIYFSSCSIWQKLFHTLSLGGRTHNSSTWLKTFGLDPQALEGLDLQIKSIFVLPVSIIHPKYIMIDRQLVFLPSCNVSWENWFEGCVEMSGPIVNKFVDFWTNFWASDADRQILWQPSNLDLQALHTDSSKPPATLAHESMDLKDVPAVFLPSAHHQNPRITLPWQHPAPPPPTPLNLFLLTALDKAQHSIYIQTPNLTSRPVIAGLLRALQRGVNVQIVTSEKLMVLEQLVTAWTTTSRCVTAMVRQYETLRGASSRDLESGLVGKLGHLRVAYYVPRAGVQGPGEPVQSHLKLTVVDDETVVLGSGNMDRPSWYTSQELGVAFTSTEFAGVMKKLTTRALEARTKLVFDSNG